MPPAASPAPAPDQYQQWTNQLVGEEGANSGNIFQNAARLGNANASQSAVAGNVAQANDKIDQIKQSNAAAAQTAAADPSKAKMVLQPNNQGYAFYDGTGNRISINQYSLLIGKTPAQLLQDSPNPEDQKFVQDYTTLQNFVTAWVNGDTQTLAKMKAADPGTFNTLISQYKTPANVINAFTQHWSDYYSPNVSSNQSSNTGDFSPNVYLNPQPPKNVAATLGSSPLSSILNSNTQAAPAQGPNLSLLDKINPFSSAKKQVNSYESYLQNPSNSWAAYQASTNPSNPYQKYATSLLGSW